MDPGIRVHIVVDDDTPMWADTDGDVVTIRIFTRPGHCTIQLTVAATDRLRAELNNPRPLPDIERP